MTTTPEPALPESWTQVLDTILEALAQGIAAATEREQASPAGPQPAAPADWQPAMAAVGRRLDELQAAARRAEACTAEVEAQVQAGAEALRQWLSASAAVRHRLAGGAARGV